MIGSDVEAMAAQCGSTAVGAIGVASKPAGLNVRESLQPREEAHTEVAVWILRGARAGPNIGKAEVLWEETGVSTTGAAGVGVQARWEGFAEIRSGSARKAWERRMSRSRRLKPFIGVQGDRLPHGKG